MVEDGDLKVDVEMELLWDPSVDHAHIGVAVADGVVALSGRVHSLAEKQAVVAAAHRVRGVRGVADELEVRYPSQKKTGDDEIARRICAIFDWDPIVPDEGIEVTVDDGWVDLTGTVDWRYQSDAAYKAACRISGVVSVRNEIKVRQRPTPADVRERIAAAFRRHASLDADKINIVLKGSEVTLGGRVPTWSERMLAERAAWAAPGVSEIHDNIVVG